MKIVLSVDKDRIAPVFDVARDFISYDTSAAGISRAQKLSIKSDSAHGLIFHLAEAGTEILICGAISRQLQLHAEGSGIVVYGFLTGNSNDLLRTFVNCNACDMTRFSMPGCRQRFGRVGRRRRAHSPE